MPLIDISKLQQVTAVNISSDGGAIGGPVVIPSVAEISIVWTLAGGKQGHCVLHGRYTGTFAGTVAQATAIHQALTGNSQFTAFNSHLAPTTLLQAVGIRDLNTPFQGQFLGAGTVVAGSGPSPALPNEVALVATLHTALSGRANRGRMYTPGWNTASVVADNTVLPAAMTDYQAWCNIIQGALNASGYQLVIGQKARQAYTGTTGTAHPARPAGSVPVTSIFVRDNHWDSQRRGLK